MPGEFGPRRAGGEIDRAPLFVAVTEVADAAEKIAQVGQGDERVSRRGMLDVVVPLDDFADHLGKLPGLTQDDAAVRVGEAERFPFLLVERAAALNRCGEHFAELLGVGQRIDDDAEVVQQAGEVGFVWIVVFDAFGKFAADQGATKRMPPEDRGIDDPFVLRDQIAETVAEQDVFDALDAESEDSGLNGLRRAGAGVERRIGDAQELRKRTSTAGRQEFSAGAWLMASCTAVPRRSTIMWWSPGAIQAWGA